MAKTFAYSVGAEVLGVNTLDTIAEAAPADVSALTAVIDAQRGDVVVRSFIRGPEGFFLPTGDQRSFPSTAGCRNCPPGMAVTGPALPNFASRLPAHVTMLDREILDAPGGHGRPISPPPIRRRPPRRPLEPSPPIQPPKRGRRKMAIQKTETDE